MYRTVVTSPQQAVVHLLLHCGNKNGEFHLRELSLVAEAVELLESEREVDLDREIERYLSYRRNMTDENAYLRHLLATIKPRLKLALLWRCVQIMAKDSAISFTQEILMQKIADGLRVKQENLDAIYDLALQMSAAQNEKAF